MECLMDCSLLTHARSMGLHQDRTWRIACGLHSPYVHSTICPGKDTPPLHRRHCVATAVGKYDNALAIEPKAARPVLTAQARLHATKGDVHGASHCHTNVDRRMACLCQLLF